MPAINVSGNQAAKPLNTVFKMYPVVFELSLHLQAFLYKISHVRHIHASGIANENALFFFSFLN